MRALIFGAAGQDGFYLSRLCRERDIEPICISRSGTAGIKGDIRNRQMVEQLIKDHLPDYIFHLAANSSTRHETVFENHETIATGTLNILESAYRFSPHTKVFLTGSGVQFKNNGVPISENDEFAANSPYAVARIQSVYAARYYRALGMKIYVGYLFHHESPLRKMQHTSQMIVQGVLQIAKGQKQMLEIGDLSVEKEWVFAGDVVAGILTLIQQEQVFEAVIGSGITYTIQNWVEQCLKRIGKENWQDYVRVNSGFVPEYRRLVSNPRLIKSLGWKPIVDFKELAGLMLENGENIYG
jgi:GDPmannose 4,6-dehydratase